jgi:cardiolipin synthase
VIGRDVAIVLGVAIAWLFSLPVRVAPLNIGKASTVVQVAFIGVVLLLLALDLDLPAVVFVATLATAAVTTASWLAYGQLLFRALALGRPAA